MKKLLTMLAACLSLNTQADDSLKIATIDMQQLFKEYHRTNEAQQQINVERARIQKENNERHYLEGWSQAELAAEAGVSVKAIESRMARLRRKARSMIETREIEER